MNEKNALITVGAAIQCVHNTEMLLTNPDTIIIVAFSSYLVNSKQRR
ncbi:MAG: hypothetical protein Q4C42_04375 [Clostridia bacterium]|nr:hypothetical protein [Clostridia bacterium]